MSKPAKTPTKHKFDIFEVLGNINKKNEDYLTEMTDEQQKAVQPVLLQRWMSGTDSARQIYLLNEVANPYMFSLYKHKQLLWQLLTVCAPGSFKRYTWMGQKSAKHGKMPVSTKTVCEYYKYSEKHARDALLVLTVEQVMELAQHMGYQPDDISNIKKEFNAEGKRK